jgi:hypothetical protein
LNHAVGIVSIKPFLPIKPRCAPHERPARAFLTASFGFCGQVVSQHGALHLINWITFDWDLLYCVRVSALGELSFNRTRD